MPTKSGSPWDGSGPGAGRGEVHLLPDGVGAVYDNFGYRVLQLPRPGVGRGDVLVNLLPDGVDVVYDNHAWQFRPGAGRGEVIANLLTDAAGAVYGAGDYPVYQARQGKCPCAPRHSIGLGYDGMVGEYLRLLLAFVGIGACSVAVNGLAAALLLGSLFLVILRVLRV